MRGVARVPGGPERGTPGGPAGGPGGGGFFAALAGFAVRFRGPIVLS
ncbi:MAG TPA: hypothetical protein VMH35_19315 [Streptosporangiaceae bacterium]|nr:hypothetical protein [Streptosporangiaceae bacterium]